MIRLLHVYHPTRTILLVGYEVILIALSFAVAIVLRWDPTSYDTLTGPAGLLQLAVTTGTYLLCLYYLDSYDIRMITNRSELIWRLFWVLGFASVILAGIEYLAPSLIVVRDVYVLAITISLAFLLIARIVFSKLVRKPAERMALIGLSDFAITLARQIQARPDLGIDIVGYLDDGQTPTNVDSQLACLGSTDELTHVVEKIGVSTLVVAAHDRRGRLPMEELLRLRVGGMKIYEAGTLCEQIVGKLPVKSVLSSSLIFCEGFGLRPKLTLVQRFYSVIFAALGLIALLPVMILVAIAIKLDSEGPILYSQERVGLRGRTFTLYKFRSMRQEAERDTGPTWASERDHRITRVGGFLRVSHLDEIPQLWNILRGEMNLVGPRPERPSFVKALEASSSYYEYRHLVRPGITGWQQVSSGYCSTIEEQLERLTYDLFYIKNISLSLDFFVLFKTGRIIVWGRGAR
jgi:sugar transferase (PEP-CTERM system associated)